MHQSTVEELKQELQSIHTKLAAMEQKYIKSDQQVVRLTKLNSEQNQKI
jgi:hypothetical protein